MLKFFKIDVEREDVPAAEAFLIQEEREAAAAIGDDFLRRRFAVVRGILRRELSRCLRVDAAEIKLGETENGKRFIAGPADKVFFSVTHTRKCSLLAVADYEIGIDAEEIRPLNYAGIMKYCFNEAERRAAESSQEMFFKIWTAKEAAVKLRGGSLFKPESLNACCADSRIRIHHKTAGNFVLAAAVYRKP